MAKPSKKATLELQKKESIKKNILLAAVTLIGVGLLQIAFAGVYLAAFHSPKPKQLPIAIVGEKTETQPLAKVLQEKSKGAYKVSQLTSYDDAQTQMKEQSYYMIYQPAFPESKITVASANSKSLAESLPATLSGLDKAFQAEAREKLALNPETAPLARAPISSPKVKDIAPLPEGDSQGVALFYTAFSAVFGGYLAAVALNMVRGKRKFTRQAVLVRTASFAIFAAVTGMIISLLVTHGVSAMPTENYWAIAGICALTTFGVSMLTSAIVSVVGVVGTALVILFFVILGNPASGGVMPVALTGAGPWHHLSGVLPTGPASDAIRQVVYFDGLQVMRHLWTPILYAMIGFVALFFIGLKRSSISPYDSAIAEDVEDDKQHATS